MRFKRLRLTNITSLRGEHVLDFNEALGDEELFAITGATGSGKSSLLNAISLALYGNTYKTLSQWEFVTQDEEEGSIDLEFSSAGIDYRALWRCKKHVDKHGVLKPKYARELMADGELTDRPIEEVVGLNFEQFKKTIILNQGQFAEFLTASFSERKAILENLAGAELLSQMSRELKDKVRELSKAQGELLARLEGGQVFSEEFLAQTRQEITELEAKRPTLELHATRFEEDEKTLKELTRWLSDITRYRAQEEGTKLEVQSANDRLQTGKDEFREWQIEFDQFIQLRDQRRPELQIAVQLEKSLESKKVQEHALASKESERKRREDQWEKERDAWLKRINEIQSEMAEQPIDLEYQKLSPVSLKAVEALIGEWDEALKKVNVTQARLEHAIERMEDTKKRGGHAAREIEQINLDQNKLSAHTDELKNIDQLRARFEVLNRDLPLWEEQGRIIDDLKRRLKAKQQDNDLKLDQARTREEHLKVLSLELENARLKKRQFELEHALMLVRQKAADDGACPACGHEWNDQAHEHHHAKVEVPNNLEELELNVANERARLESLQALIADNKKEIAELTKQTGEIQTKHQQLEVNLKSNNSVKLHEERQALQVKLKQLEESEIQLKHFQTLLKSKQNEREALLKEWNQQQELKESLALEMKNLEQLVARSYQDLKSRLHAMPEDFEAAKAFLKQQGQLFNTRAKLEQEQLGLNERLKAGEIEAKQRAKDRNADASARTVLLQEIQHIYEQLKPLIPEGDVTKALRALELQEEEWNQHKDKWNAKLKELEQKSESAHTRHGFMSEQLKKARSELERTLANLTKRPLPVTMTKIQAGFIPGLEKIKQLKQAQQVEEASNEIAIWYNDFFIPEAKRAKDELKELDTLLIEHRKALAIDAKKREEMEQFKVQLDVINAQKKRWDALALVLGQDEFRNFTLSLVEERLVAQTNRELEHLCEGRYQITLLENKKQSQDFLVIDHWRGGGERKVSTLSGGETFLVSLAMALSLAELTRGQTEVDAFFIDEGFGTLDRDSIDDVLEVLSNVQSRGKQIGLISHVKALTDRIPVNLHLEKSTLGDSKIRVIYN